MIAPAVLAALAPAAAPYRAQAQVTIDVHAVEPARLELWRAAAEARPALRGFRAPILARASEPLHLELAAGADPRAARAAELVARRLARDGLRATLVAAVVELGPDRVIASGGVRLLESIGLPVDLLGCWTQADGEPPEQRVARALESGRSQGDVAAEIAALPFAFQPTIPGWRIATESGEHAAAALRLQVSSARDYARPGEGGALDVFRELARLLPDVPMVASVAAEHESALAEEARRVAGSRSAPIRIVREPLPVAQWAQDVAKPGHVESDGAAAVAWLAPRYASRGEDGTAFVPGENLLIEGFAATGRTVAQSPLLFQGGNLLAVREPRDGTRFLVVGEAELARNRALGLARDEVLAALRAELGVDRCVVLPAISFHVDLDVCVRATATGLVACLLDTSRAARIVLSCGLDALHRAGHLSAADHGAARTDLDAGRRGELLERIGPLLQAHQHGPGRYGESFARVFSVAPEDSGVGNIQRLLLAIDVWTAEQLGDASAEEVRIDADSWAYLDSIRRRERDRIQVATALAGLGWRIAAVPGLSDGSRSLNPLNGIHLPGRYLMPAYGGLYAPLDAAGAEALREAFGDAVRIEPVPCAETQRRAGGLHCAVSVEPAR